MEERFNGRFFALQVSCGLYLEGLIHGAAYFRNFTDKFESNNVTKSFQRYLVLDILTNPNNVTLTEKVAFLGKSTANVTVYLLLFDKSHNVWLLSLKIKFFPCLKSWLATIIYKKRR